MLVIIRVTIALAGGYQKDLKKQLLNLKPEKVSFINKEYEEGRVFQGEIRIGNRYLHHSLLMY